MLSSSSSSSEQMGRSDPMTDYTNKWCVYPYNKVTGCLSVFLYRRISLTAEPLLFSTFQGPLEDSRCVAAGFSILYNLKKALMNRELF